MFLDVPRSLWMLLAVISVVAVRQARRKRQPWTAIRAAALRQPSWWRGFYPRAGRAPGDVWDRLPSPIRRFRSAFFPFVVVFWLGLGTLTMAITYAGEAYARTGTPNWLQEQGPWPVWTVVGVLTGIALLGIHGRLAVRQLVRTAPAPVDEDDASRLLWASTSRRSFWARPGIAPLLASAPEAGVDRTGSVPTSPVRIERSLERLLDRWPAERRPLAEEVRDAVRRCRIALQALEREIESLRRDLAPEEGPRLAARLESLGLAGEEDPPERQEMRDLLARQLDLVRDVERHLAEKRRERDARLASLRHLWEAVARGGSGETDQRVRRLCSELSGEAEAATLTGPGERSGPTSGPSS